MCRWQRHSVKTFLLRILNDSWAGHNPQELQCRLKKKMKSLTSIALCCLPAEYYQWSHLTTSSWDLTSAGLTYFVAETRNNTFSFMTWYRSIMEFRNYQLTFGITTYTPPSPPHTHTHGQSGFSWALVVKHLRNTNDKGKRGIVGVSQYRW